MKTSILDALRKHLDEIGIEGFLIEWEEIQKQTKEGPKSSEFIAAFPKSNKFIFDSRLENNYFSPLIFQGVFLL